MQPRTLGITAAATAMLAVGSGITISNDLAQYPVFSSQAIRYGLAAMILIAGLKVMGRPLPRPRGSDWVWLFLLAATGQALYNVAVVRAVEHAEPAAVAVLIGAVPLVLVIADSIRTGRRPHSGTLVGVMLVVAGAALVQGGGRTTATGIAWSLLALACEASFTLLAVPILNRLGPFGVSTHTCWIAALQLVVLAVLVDQGGAFPPMTGDEVFAIGYLAMVLTAVAFVLWYSAVQRLGAPVAGLFAGLIPVAAAVTGLIFGLTTITPPVLGGAAVVGVGIALGLASDSRVPATSINDPNRR